VKEKTLGIIGLGAIGKRIAEIGQAMGMDALYWSRSARDERFRYTDLETLLKASDFIFPTLAKNVDTTNLIDTEKLKHLRKEAYIVSITGDELFDLKYAVHQVKQGNLAGIAFESEKNKIDDYEGNVLVTPPIAWYTKEALAEDIRIWVASIKGCAENQPINIIN